MKKKVLILSLLCLFLCTISYTYSAFRNTIEGTINATTKWVFKLKVDGGIKEENYYNVPINGTSGSFDITIDNSNNVYGASYIIELEPINLPADIIINDLRYEDNITKNSKTYNVKYSSSSSVNGYIKVKVEARKYEYAVMKNGSSDYGASGTEFWNSNYKSYIRKIEFNNNLDNLPSSCTKENLCWDISYNTTDSNKVYGYLLDSGEVDSSSNILYNLYIVSKYEIYAPIQCYSMFNEFSNLVSIEFNNNFNTSNVINMSYMFNNCKAITTLDLSNFDTINVIYMDWMFSNCTSLTSLNLSNFNTSNVTNMGVMFSNCSALTALDLSGFNTSKVTNMCYMFNNCNAITTLDLSGCNTSKVTNMSYMFNNCNAITILDLSNFDTINVIYMDWMFSNCTSLTSLNLLNFNTSNVTNMGVMFSNCSALTTLDLSSFNTSSVTDMSYMFNNCNAITTTINITGTSVNNYNFMFSNVSSAEGAQITVNYIETTSDLVDKMITTKSSNSNVIKGNIIYEHTITINDNTDITYQSNNRYVGALITLNSTSGSNVTSFKMNGTLIEGNTFTMPDTDVIVTDIITQ